MKTNKKDALFAMIGEAIKFVRKANGYTDDLIIGEMTKHICGKIDAFLEEMESGVIAVADYSTILAGIKEFNAGRN